MESLCSGCGAVAELHPYVGVARDQETGHMASYPVCFLCWKDPEHRQVTLKMHFFEQQFADQAVAAAEENILVEKPEERERREARERDDDRGRGRGRR